MPQGKGTKMTSPKLETKEYYSLYQLLMHLTRCNRFNSSKISPKIKAELLKETFINAQGVETKMFIFPTPAGATTRPYLSIHREAIPEFLKKWGTTFQVPNHVISNTKKTYHLPDITDKMISTFDFCKKIKAPKSLAFWMNENAFLLLENKDKSNPFFLLAKDVFMFQTIVLLKENLNNFILQNQEILRFHRLPEIIIEKAHQNKVLDYLENNLGESYTKETDINLPKLRLDELSTYLKKTTLFIPHLKKFILQNCLNDTFELKLNNDKTQKMPVFLYYNTFKKDKPSCYIYTQSIPYFVQKYEQELLSLGVKQAVIRDILKKNNLKSSLEGKIISFYDAYLLCIPNVDFNTFKNILKLSAYSTLTQTNEKGEQTTKEGVIYVQTTLKDPYFINTNALIQILNHHKEDLHITNENITRTKILINSPQKTAIPVTYFLKNIGLSKKNAPAFNLKILKPNMACVLSTIDNGNKKTIVPFGFFKNQAGNNYIGVYLDATKAIIQHFKKEFIEMGISKERIEKLENLEANTPQKISTSKPNALKQSPQSFQRSKED